MEAAILKWNAIKLRQPGNVGGAMISAARSCEENDLEACYRRYLLTYEYAYLGGGCAIGIARRLVGGIRPAPMQGRHGIGRVA